MLTLKRFFNTTCFFSQPAWTCGRTARPGAPARTTATTSCLRPGPGPGPGPGAPAAWSEAGASARAPRGCPTGAGSADWSSTATAVSQSSTAIFLPNHQRSCAKWKLSWNILHTTHFCTLGANLHAQSVLISKISASELRKRLIKSALLVG